MSALPEHVLMALEHRALTEIELRERIASLEQDVDTYRVVAQEAIHALHHAVADRDRLTRENIRLRELLRERRAA